MAKKKTDNSGLMSSAGLMRYFEADDTAIKLNPKDGNRSLRSFGCSCSRTQHSF